MISQAQSKRISQKTRDAYVNAWRDGALPSVSADKLVKMPKVRKPRDDYEGFGPAKLQVNDAGQQGVRVQMAYQVNASTIRRETHNGREILVVPSFTLPDGVVMNRGLYPADEIEKAYQGLEGTLAPAGHPVVNGTYVSAMTAEAINEYHIGAWNRNVKRDGHRVSVEKWIDVETAKLTEKGRAVLNAIDKGEPIHTSTGIFLQQEMTPNAKGYEWIARNMQMDHDAILIGEIGAATPAEGVGMLVNVAEATELSVNDKGLFDKFVQWLKLDVNSEPSTSTTPSKDADDMTPDELKAILAEERKATVDAVNEAIGKPLGDRLTALETNITANARAQEAEQRAAVAAQFGEVVANALQGEALAEMFKKTQTTEGARTGVHNSAAGQPTNYDLPE